MSASASKLLRSSPQVRIGGTAYATLKKAAAVANPCRDGHARLDLAGGTLEGLGGRTAGSTISMASRS
jgi:hypothetical protein